MAVDFYDGIDPGQAPRGAANFYGGEMDGEAPVGPQGGAPGTDGSPAPALGQRPECR